MIYFLAGFKNILLDTFINLLYYRITSQNCTNGNFLQSHIRLCRACYFYRMVTSKEGN